MGMIKEIEKSVRKETSGVWLSHFNKPKAKRDGCSVGVHQGTQNKGKKAIT